MFNPEKFQLVAFGYSGNIYEIVMRFDDSVIKCQRSADHLGYILEEKGDNGISRLIDDFTAKVIVSYPYFKVVFFYVLFNTFCMPLYCAILWDFSGDMVNAFWVRWRKCRRRVLDLPNRTHNSLLHLMCDDITVTVQLQLRFEKVFYNLMSELKYMYFHMIGAVSQW